MPEDNLTVGQIKKRVVSSFISLSARQVLLRAMAFVTINVVLANILPVATLGIFNIAQSIITFFAFFSDVGLAASLIQKKDAVSDDDIQTTFTVQQILVGIICIVVFIAAPQIANFYSLDSSGMWLVRILAFSFFLSSLKVVPSVLLERNLKFQPLITVELVENLTFNILLIVLSFRGFDIWSFSIAALARGLSGVILIYLLAPVRLRYKINPQSAKQLLSFGVFFQTNNILALMKDKLVDLLVARMIGVVGVGYVSWAQALAQIPMEIMTMVIRITFPAFARLQDDKNALGKGVTKSLFLTALLVYPAIFGLGAILPTFVGGVINAKWEPAVPSYYLFAINTYWAVISTTFTNVLNASGHIKTTLKLMIMWVVLTWILTPILTAYYGFIGVGISSFVISFSSIITIYLVKRIINVKVLEAIVLPTSASIFMGIVVYFISQKYMAGWISLAVIVGIGMICYGGFIYTFGRKQIMEDIKTLRS